MKRSKYGNIKVTVDGITFDSKAEAKRYGELKQLFIGKKITHLAWQIPFQLTAHGKLICNYIADFTYVENGQYIVEDVKGIITKDFAIKAKLFAAQYGYPIRLVNVKKKVKVKKLPAAYALGGVPNYRIRARAKKKLSD